MIPLLYTFIDRDVRHAATPGGWFSVGPTTVLGKYQYFNWPLNRSRGDGAVRAYDSGYWAAFGHVTVDGEFRATGEFDCAQDGYIVHYKARYHIEDFYEWMPNGEEIETPVAPLAKSPGNIPRVPHVWAESLVNAGRANEFRYTVTWMDEDILFIMQDFSRYRKAWVENSWDYYQVPSGIPYPPIA